MREYRLLRDAAEEDERRRWERARWQMFLALQMNPYVKRKPSSPALWAPFPWEREAEAERAREADWSIGDAEQAELDRIMDEFINSRNK